MATGRRLVGNVPRLTGRSWEDVAQGLEEYLRRIRDSESDGIPPGWGQLLPSNVEAGVAPDMGDQNSGWSAADHAHTAETLPPSMVGVELVSAEGNETALARSDHVHEVLSTRTFGITIDSPSNISMGFKGFVALNFSGYITGWSLTTDVAGTIEIDVWKAKRRPNALNSICGSWKPKLLGQTHGTGETWAWTDTTVAKGEIVGFNVEAPATVTRATLVVEVRETEVLYPGIVAYWKLDEVSGTRYDSVGSAHLLDVNTVGSVTGQIGNAATFDNASSQYLQSAKQVNISGVNGFTFTCWLKVLSGAPTGANWFYNGSVFVSSIGLSTANVGPKVVHFGLVNDLGESIASGGIDLPAYDTWYFIVGTYDPAIMKPSMSVNGGPLVPSVASLTQHPIVTDAYGIGKVWVGGYDRHSFYSKSQIDEIGLFNRVLSQTDIQYLMSLRRPPAVA